MFSQAKNDDEIQYDDFVLFRLADHTHDENEAQKKVDPKALEKKKELKRLGTACT